MGLTDKYAFSPRATTSFVRCNSVVSHKISLKQTAMRKVEPRQAARHTVAAVDENVAKGDGSGGRGRYGGPSVALAAYPAPATKNRSHNNGDRDRDRDRAALLARLNSAVSPRSSSPVRNRHADVVGNGGYSNHVRSSEARRMERQRHGSPTRATADLAVSDSFSGKVWIGDRSGGHKEEERIAHRGEDGSASARGSLRWVQYGTVHFYRSVEHEQPRSLDGIKLSGPQEKWIHPSTIK